MGNISLTNSEISNCGESCMVMIGGSAKIAHVTITNYYRSERFGETAQLRLQQEYNLVLSHTLIKGKKIENPMFYNCRWAMSQNVKNAKDTVFVNTSITDIEKTGYYNFRLDSLSHARNIGSQAVSHLYPTDLDGNSRTSDSAPTLEPTNVSTGNKCRPLSKTPKHFQSTTFSLMSYANTKLRISHDIILEYSI